MKIRVLVKENNCEELYSQLDAQSLWTERGHREKKKKGCNID